MRYTCRQAGRRRAKGLLGKVRPGERLAVYCHGEQTWNLIQKVTISSYTLCAKTLLFGEQLN
jgi:hypothetical protein